MDIGFVFDFVSEELDDYLVVCDTYFRKYRQITGDTLELTGTSQDVGAPRQFIELLRVLQMIQRNCCDTVS